MKLSISDIVTGYWNLAKDFLGFLPKEIKEIADKRKFVCDNCSVKNSFLGVDYCDPKQGGCGCVLSAKRLCFGDGCNCPLSKWI